MKALFLTLLLCYSCTRKAQVTKDAMGTRVVDVQMDISHINEVTWHVGQKKEAKVTQSFIFVLEMPHLKKKDLAFLQKERGIDAWIVRLIQVKNSSVQDLGSLYTLFTPKNVSRGASTGAAASVSVQVYYAAGFPSLRFRHFKCPAFGHAKRIRSLKISGENEPFEITLGQGNSYGEKSALVQLAPTAFNGGNDLKAEYHLEIAPYNSEKKTIMASFKRIPRYVEVSNEETQSIPSCQGVHQEYDQ